ncbi:hypothetical protein SH611_17600 [Geminicoccaceae bacterium 1502E]|nr:hypothetical protein [Geminicoccaceae bacterium 1502E]
MNILIGGAALYGAVVTGLYLAQDTMLFPRHAASIATYPLPAGAERLTLQTPDGAQLTGHLVRARQPSRGLLLGFPGNAWNAQDMTVFLAHRLPDLDIAVFHYRGYAPSEGEPGEEAFYADAALIHDALVRRLEPARVVAAGFSLGSSVASWLAGRRALAGLLLVTPFDSIEAIARTRYFWAPVGRLIKNRFRSSLHLKDSDVPTAVILASRDRIVPPERSQALLRVLRCPVLVETVPHSTHNGIYDHEEFDHLLERSMELLVGVGGQRPGGDAALLPVCDPEAAAALEEAD